MNRSPQSMLSPADVLRILREHPRRWIVPTVALTLVAAVYAVVRPRTWDASQALIVRDEASNNSERPGKFKESEQMKIVQETIVEIAKSRSVLRTALVEVGPPNDGQPHPEWPTDKDVENLQQAIKLSPPGGAEFGKTEVFYLHVKDHNPVRAVALAEAVWRHLQIRFQEVREENARSRIAELSETVALANADLQSANSKLAKLESEVGSDLAELRILHSSPSGGGELRQRVNNLEAEIRKARNNMKVSEELLDLLRKAQSDPVHLLAAPNRLLESQPALKLLKNGLVDAQLRTAQLAGIRKKAHPLVKGSSIAEDEIRERLHEELSIAIRGVEADRKLSAAQAESFGTQLAATTARLERLADQRVEYSRMVAAVDHQTTVLQQAQRELSDARASQAAAVAISLISRIDTPNPGTAPVGPRGWMIVMMGTFGGAFVGLGILVLTVEPRTIVPVATRAMTVSPYRTPRNGFSPLRYGAGPLAVPGRNLSLGQALTRVSGTECADRHGDNRSCRTTVSTVFYATSRTMHEKADHSNAANGHDSVDRMKT